MAAEALYLHIPFCRARCAYCDFETAAPAAGLLAQVSARYLDELERRLDAFGARGALRAVKTVYIGGGTPSVVGERLPRLVTRVRRWCAPAEFSCEANPESFTEELAEALAAAGVTRISLGVQTLDDAELAAIGRIHTAQMALDALDRARRQGFRVSCDLMCGLPGQTAESWERTVRRALAAGPDHISVYPLTLEEGTPLARRAERDPSLVPDEDVQAACMERARTLCREFGLAPYEVASYARPGCACQHNIAYWSGVSYLGIGRSAAGMLARDEFEELGAFFPGAEVPADADRVRMVQRDDAGMAFEFEYLTAREALAEDLMLSMRMTAGAPRALVDRAREAFGREFDRACDTAVAEGLARFDAERERLVPTERGWLMGNELYGLMWGLAG